MAYLALVCPVAAANWAKKGKVENASVGAVAGGLGTTNVKPDVGDTGAPVQYHTKKEYMKLTKEQCTELTAWNKSNGGKLGKPGGAGK